jgi:hypothetical protein
MRFFKSFFGGGAALLIAGPALGQVHATDLVLSVENGRIVTGRVEGGVPVWPRYVFAGTFGDTGIPGVTFNPGCDSENGVFASSQPVGLTIRKALRIWNGQNGFAPVPGSPPVTTLTLTKNTTTIATPPADPANCGVGDSLLLGLANSLGRLHQHPAYQLVGQGDPGIYALELEVWMTDPATGVSDPVLVLLNQNDTQANNEAALAWAEANFHAGGCYANCDGSTTTPALNVNDFVCFQSRFAAGDCYANCDGSTTPPLLNVNDFVCFQSRFAAGCP